jgi:hypothetical protein
MDQNAAAAGTLDRALKVARRPGLTLLLGSLLCWTAVHAADSPIQAKLAVPEAEHVVGDPIALIWRFQNQSTNPLAFMWEGCCRLNGRLNVTHQGEALIPIPPAAATAHQFARAIRLDPGKSQEFTTFLHDWITLQDTGEYQLSGHYRGVLPEQRPQVPRGVELWRDETDTAPISVKLIATPEYLRQRVARSTRRQLTLELRGPATVSPLVPSPLTLRLTNQSPQPQKLAWPGAFQLWVLNLAGNRLPNAAIALEAPSEELVLAPGATVERTVPLSASLFEGEPFGEYGIFVDLAADAQQPRLPSNDISVHWRLGAKQVMDLLRAAAPGPATGARNAPLKWLRTYLPEIRASLEDAVAQSTPESPLARDLLLAARLKPVAPQPGLVNVAVDITPDGAWRFHDSALLEILGTEATFASLTRLLAVRRHLGWEVAVALRPEEPATLEQIMAVAGEISPLQGDLAAPVRALVPVPNAALPAVLAFQTNQLPANFLVRVTQIGNGVVLEAARRLPDPAQPQLSALIPPSEFWSAPFRSLNTPQALEALLDDGQLKSPQILVIAARTLAWQELLEAIAPLLRRGLPVDISLAK